MSRKKNDVVLLLSSLRTLDLDPSRNQVCSVEEDMSTRESLARALVANTFPTVFIADFSHEQLERIPQFYYLLSRPTSLELDLLESQIETVAKESWTLCERTLQSAS